MTNLKPSQNLPPQSTSIALLPLLLSLGICLLITICPLILTDLNGKANHSVAGILFWGMSAGFVRGIGYIPQFWLFRQLLSQQACYLACTIVLYLLYREPLIHLHSYLHFIHQNHLI